MDPKRPGPDGCPVTGAGEWPPPDGLEAAGAREWHAGLATWELEKRSVTPSDLLGLEALATEVDELHQCAELVTASGIVDETGKKTAEWVAYQESAAAMHQVWPTIGDQERRWENLAALTRSVPCYDVTIARNENVQRAMKYVTQAMLDG